MSGFVAAPPPAMLWEGDFPEKVATGSDCPETTIVLEAVREKMPLVLVMVWSMPRQLQSIEWAVAELDGDGKVQLHGQEALWEPEIVADDATSDVESFDSGARCARRRTADTGQAVRCMTTPQPVRSA
ncbi:hypothetical protein [Cellulosimicrobium sp. NPDC055967]|uniref:hypothetical protein n=1 Tax=Cellulosimicrobium sp. NPDC055967 TaxID=3345670 RepID=UPI0035DED165